MILPTLLHLASALRNADADLEAELFGSDRPRERDVDEHQAADVETDHSGLLSL